jgi:hypothetical protein
LRIKKFNSVETESEVEKKSEITGNKL